MRHGHTKSGKKLLRKQKCLVGKTRFKRKNLLTAEFAVVVYLHHANVVCECLFFASIWQINHPEVRPCSTRLQTHIFKNDLMKNVRFYIKLHPL